MLERSLGSFLIFAGCATASFLEKAMGDSSCGCFFGFCWGGVDGRTGWTTFGFSTSSSSSSSSEVSSSPLLSLSCSPASFSTACCSNSLFF
jgi:hypothetical protein